MSKVLATILISLMVMCASGFTLLWYHVDGVTGDILRNRQMGSTIVAKMDSHDKKDIEVLETLQLEAETAFSHFHIPLPATRSTTRADD